MQLLVIKVICLWDWKVGQQLKTLAPYVREYVFDSVPISYDSQHK